MAVKVLQIIGIAVIIVAAVVFVLLLPFLSKALKKLNRTISTGRPAIAREVSTSFGEMEAAQNQIDAVAVVTDSLRSAMKSAVTVTDGVVDFLESNAFQVGLPVLVWFLVITVSILRGVRPRRAKKAAAVIPPPSWETGPE